MSMTDNKIIQKKDLPFIARLKIVSGLIHIYKGAHLAYKAGKIGYVGLAADEITSRYVGIALEEKNLAAADNSADGTYDIEVYHKASKEVVSMKVTSTITIANEGDSVYMDTDDSVDIATGIVNSTTNGKVGVIRQFIDSNNAWVQFQD